MPRYEYLCPSCGPFEKRAGYDDREVVCPCGSAALRSEVNRPNFVMAGRSMPSRSDPVAVQQELFKEVRKAGWDGPRAIEALRANRVEDKEGRQFVDFKGLPKST